jgi:hypothetical protein
MPTIGCALTCNLQLLRAEVVAALGSSDAADDARVQGAERRGQRLPDEHHVPGFQGVHGERGQRAAAAAAEGQGAQAQAEAQAHTKARTAAVAGRGARTGPGPVCGRAIAGAHSSSLFPVPTRRWARLGDLAYGPTSAGHL